MANIDESEKKKTGFVNFFKKDITAPASEFLPELESGIFSQGTKDAAKGMSSFLKTDLTIGGRGTKIKNATTQNLIAVVNTVTQKGDKLTHGELDILFKIATDAKTEKQTLTLLQNAREPEKYQNKNLVVTRVQSDDIIPALKLLRKLDNTNQASAIAKKVNPGDVKEALPFLLPFLDRNIRLSLINKCPVADLGAVFESFNALPMTKDELDFLRKAKLRPEVILLIFNAADTTSYSPELIHWTINHTSGENIYAIYQKTHDYLDEVLHHSEHGEHHELVIHLYKLMFMNISPNFRALTNFIQSPTPGDADLASLKNIFSLLEKESMYLYTSSNASDMYNKFLRLSYDICCLTGKQELFDRAKESLFIKQNLSPSVPAPQNIVNAAAAQLLDYYAKAYGIVMTRYKQDQFPQFIELARLLNEITLSFRR